MKRLSILSATLGLTMALANGCATAVPPAAPPASACLYPSVRNSPGEVARGNRLLTGSSTPVRNPRPEVARGNAIDDARANRVINSSDREVARGNRRIACAITLAAR